MIQLYQPSGSNLCGQTCVAMLVDVSIDAVCQVMGKRGCTRTIDIQRALIFYGYDVQDVVTGLKPDALLPDDAIVNWHWPKQSRGHWLLRFQGRTYDPDGIPPRPNMRVRPGGWVSKYIAFRKVN